MTARLDCEAKALGRGQEKGSIRSLAECTLELGLPLAGAESAGGRQLGPSWSAQGFSFLLQG